MRSRCRTELPSNGSMIQRYRNTMNAQRGKIGYILMWLLGIPIPILIVIFLVRGCT